MSGTYRSGPLLSGTDTVALYCRGGAKHPEQSSKAPKRNGRDYGQGQPGSQEVRQQRRWAGHVDPEYWNWPKNKQQIQKQGKRGRGNGRGVQFLIGKKMSSVISYSDIAGGKWRTGQEESNEYVFF